MNLQDDDATPGVDAINLAANVNLLVSGTGVITVMCSRSVYLNSGSSLETVNCMLTVEANQQVTPTTGNFIGVTIDGGLLRCTGPSQISVKGRGGDDATGYQLGVLVVNAGQILGGTAGALTVMGTGGASTNEVNRGVTVYGEGSRISSLGGPVQVTGQSGGAGSYFGIGLSLLYGGTISAGGTGTVAVTGTGGGFGSRNEGMESSEPGSAITSGGGLILLTGTAGPGESSGIYLLASSGITNLGVSGDITLVSDSIYMENDVGIVATDTVTLKTESNGTLVALDVGDYAGELGLSDAELDRITAGAIVIGDTNSGTFTLYEAITHPASSHFTLISGGDIVFDLGSLATGGGTLALRPGVGGSVRPNTSDLDVTTSPATALLFGFGADLAIAINGPTVDEQYSRLNVAGRINLAGVNLVLSGAYATLIAGDSFTIVDNDGADAILGPFNGLAEGAVIVFNHVPLRISYVGGDGNDVVLAYAPEIAVEQPAGTTLVDGGASISFGSVAVGASSAAKTFTITNRGTATLFLTNITKDGLQPGDFSVSALGATTLAAGDSTTFTVTFSPGPFGARSAAIHIANNDSNENPFDITLTGTGAVNGDADPGFNPSANSFVLSTVAQTDGKIVIGGQFTTICGVTRNYLARLNANGTLDLGFNPNANNYVYSTAVEADGKIVIGGEFTTVGGTTRNQIARLLNGAATQTLVVPGAARVEWLRSGTAPETTQVSFDLSTNGMTWAALGPGTRISGGWERTGLSLPATGTIRARARTTGGDANGSSGLVEQQAEFSVPTMILVNGQSYPGQTVIVTNSAVVQITSPFPSGTVRYTLDGSPPDDGVLYAGSFVLNDSAIVRAIAATADYSASAEADAVTVEVVATPFIVTQPLGRTVGLAADVSLSVTAGGTAPLNYQWRLNGLNIPGATGATLLRTNIQANQGGNYTVTVGNAFGSITRAVAQLVVFAPPSILVKPVSVTTNVGSRVTFAVSVFGPAPLTFQWRKNGVNIPGALTNFFTITNVVIDDVGSYTVVVASPGGTIVSDPAQLIVTVPSPAANNNFAAANALTNTSGSASGTNNFATHEAGEPLHAGKPGSNSVWFTWTAPATGIATFRTSGSTFDTLLAIYTGASVGALTEVASDEDSGGFLASLVSFNASSGTVYRVAIDGFNGAQGNFVLRWSLVVTNATLPVITCHPANRTVLAGESALFTVSATGTGLTYQWLFNGTPIAGATTASYTRANVQTADVGFYSVRITNSAGRSIESLAAILEIGPFPDLQSKEKADDVFVTCAGGGGLAPAAAFASVALGSIGYQDLGGSFTNNTTDCLTTNCGGIPTGARYLELTAGADATFLLDTSGSVSSNKMWICQKAANNTLRPTFLKCDTDSAADGRSRVSFAAGNGRAYQIWIAKLGANAGSLRLNWKLGHAPRLTALATNRFVREGDTTILTAQASNVVAAGVTTPLAPPVYEWFFNGTTQMGTGSTLTLSNLSFAAAGTYSVVVSNAIGATSAVVRVEVYGAPLLQTVAVGGPLQLFARDTLETCGTSVATYQWKRNGVPLTGANSRSLTLPETTTAQAGEYSVTVNNCFGTTTYAAAAIAVTVDVGFVADRQPNGLATLTWQAIPGRRYHVEYKAGLANANWQVIMPDIVATTTLTTFSELPAAPRRFYRIVLLD